MKIDWTEPEPFLGLGEPSKRMIEFRNDEEAYTLRAGLIRQNNGQRVVEVGIIADAPAVVMLDPVLARFPYVEEIYAAIDELLPPNVIVSGMFVSGQDRPGGNPAVILVQEIGFVGAAEPTEPGLVLE